MDAVESSELYTGKLDIGWRNKKRIVLFGVRVSCEPDELQILADNSKRETKGKFRKVKRKRKVGASKSGLDKIRRD